MVIKIIKKNNNNQNDITNNPKNKVILIVFGSILGLIFLLMILFIFLGFFLQVMNSDFQINKNDNYSQPDELITNIPLETINKSKTFSIGEIATDGKLNIIVLSARYTNSIGNETFSDTPAKGNSFLIIDLAIKNISNEDFYYNLSDDKLVGENYRQYSQVVSLAAYSRPSRISAGTIMPDQLLRGDVVYEVPSDLNQFEFVVEVIYLSESKARYIIKDINKQTEETVNPLLIGETLNYEDFEITFDLVEFPDDPYQSYSNNEIIRIELTMKSLRDKEIKLLQKFDNLKADAGWYTFDSTTRTDAKIVEKSYTGDTLLINPNQEIKLYVSLLSNLEKEELREAEYFEGEVSLKTTVKGEAEKTIKTKIYFTQDEIGGNKKTSCEGLIESCNTATNPDLKKSFCEVAEILKCK